MLINSITSTCLNILNDAIETVLSSRELCLVNPASDFTRRRSCLDLETVFKIPFLFSQTSITSTMPELLKLSDTVCSHVPWDSSLTQARSKILPEAYLKVFNLFNEKTKSDHLFRGYTLAAVDGSEQSVFGTSKFSKHMRAKSKNGIERGFVHINPLYDVLENTFMDVIIQPADFRNEDEALLELALNNRKILPNTIITADRGYESLILFYRLIRIGANFVIRIKDIDSYNSILRNFNFSENIEFDHWLCFNLCSTPSLIRGDPAHNKYLWNYQQIEEFRNTNMLSLNLRIARFPIQKANGETVYECLATNLDETQFSTEDLKEIYHLRWNCESGFDMLKNQAGLANLRSRTLWGIEQEIYAKITICNLASRIRNLLEAREARKPKKKRTSKYPTRINLSNIVWQIRINIFRSEDIEVFSMDDFLAREKIPIIGGRPDTRQKYKRRKIR